MLQHTTIRLFLLLVVISGIVPVQCIPSISRRVGSKSTSEQNRYVTAHFMVGIVENYTIADWKEDMLVAKETGIDAFALNCAKIDWYTPKQLEFAYEAALQVDFKVFISFDFAYWTNGDTAGITAYMKNYSAHPAQLQYKNAALVSTFVGDSFDWGPVKRSVDHPIFAVPNLQDPNAGRAPTTSIDGAFSWYAWPTDGGNSVIPGPMTTIWDDRYIRNLGNKTYMAPFSPWFFTHFNTKNWVFVCEDLITTRWEQLLTLRTDIIEIISWNGMLPVRSKVTLFDYAYSANVVPRDYGESHYIGPYVSHHSDDGSSQWAKGFPHDAWRIISKPYIAAFKSGATSPTVTSDEVVYWYRPTPKGTVCSNDTLGSPRGASMLSDSIFVTTLLTEPATLTVASGSQRPVSVEVKAGIVSSNFTIGLGIQSFSLSRGGKTLLEGKGELEIKDSCEHYNFNVYVGSLNSARQ